MMKTTLAMKTPLQVHKHLSLDPPAPKHADVIIEHKTHLNIMTHPGKHLVQTFCTSTIVTPPQFFNSGLSIFTAKQYLHFLQLLCFLETTTANDRSLSLMSHDSATWKALSTNRIQMGAARVSSMW